MLFRSAKRQFSIFEEWLAALGEVIDQALAPHPELGFVPRIGSEILQFVRIALEIEQLFLAVASVKNVFQPTVGEGVPMVFGTVGNIVFEVDILAPAGAGITNQREQAAPIDLTVQRASIKVGRRSRSSTGCGRFWPRAAEIKPDGHRISMGMCAEGSYA